MKNRLMGRARTAGMKKNARLQYGSGGGIIVSSILNPDLNDEMLRNALLEGLDGEEYSRQLRAFNQDQITQYFEDMYNQLPPEP